MSLLNLALSKYLRFRMRRIERFMEYPHDVQRVWLERLVHDARHTEWGQQHGYKSIRNYQDFCDRVPVQDYEDLKPYIERMMLGEKNILWPGYVRWFSKSSGTTSDKSKYIPVSWEHHHKCLMRGTKDTLSLYYHDHPNANIFQGKGIVMGGAWEHYGKYPKTRRGDVSALMVSQMPAVGKYFYTPDMATALMKDWEPKIERMAQITSRENVTNLGGVPTWTIVLFRRILELTGKANILEVWPDFEVYIHGGVSFDPYREQFQHFLPSGQVRYREVYNASEGYFAASAEQGTGDMLLLLDNGIFYEFIPAKEWGKEYPRAIPLEEVELDQHYAIVISTNSGLWRYTPGDTIKFTSKSPYKIRITGRTKHFINAFGEEVMVENTDKALAMTCAHTGAIVGEYTVAPIYISQEGKGGHEWLIEFEEAPRDLERFSQMLDRNLQSINSDYEAKRHKDMALGSLVLRALPQGTFYHWMKQKGKVGGQNKVPRLANHRDYVEEIMKSRDGVLGNNGGS